MAASPTSGVTFSILFDLGVDCFLKLGLHLKSWYRQAQLTLGWLLDVELELRSTCVLHGNNGCAPIGPVFDSDLVSDIVEVDIIAAREEAPIEIAWQIRTTVIIPVLIGDVFQRRAGDRLFTVVVLSSSSPSLMKELSVGS